MPDRHPSSGVAAASPAASLPPKRRGMLLRRGFALEFATLGWNIVGIVVLAVAALGTRSVALAGFGLDSLIEIGASIVVIWELSGTGADRQRRALRLIGVAFVVLAGYLAVQSTVALLSGHRPGHGTLGIGWTAATALVMFALAAGKAPDRRGTWQPGAAHRGPGHAGRCTAGHRGPARRQPGHHPRLVVGRPTGRLRHRLLRRPGGQSVPDALNRPRQDPSPAGSLMRWQIGPAPVQRCADPVN